MSTADGNTRNNTPNKYNHKRNWHREYETIPDYKINCNSVLTCNLNRFNLFAESIWSDELQKHQKLMTWPIHKASTDISEENIVLVLFLGLHFSLATSVMAALNMPIQFPYLLLVGLQQPDCNLLKLVIDTNFKVWFDNVVFKLSHIKTAACVMCLSPS